MDMGRNLALAVILALSACGGGPAADSGEPDRSAADSAAETRGQRTDSPATATDERGVVLFLGTSLTAGLGVGAENAYPAVIQERIDSAGYPFRVVNAGLSGETSAGGLRRLEWSLQEPVAVLVLELGANDGLRGLGIEELRHNLQTIIRTTLDRYPATSIVVAGMEAPPNMGAAYTTAFREVFSGVAREFDADLIPFLLDGVAADPELNQADRIHPTAAGQRRVADNVWPVLEPLLAARVDGG